MIQRNQKWNKILEVLFNFPMERMTTREIAKKAKIPIASTQRYLAQLKRDRYLTKENRLVSSPYMKYLKMQFMIEKLYECGLLEYLEKQFAPAAMILFGSIRKGEYDTTSDIDLFIETTKTSKPNLAPFEKKLNRPIQLFIEKDIHHLPPKLFNNVINGIKLQGYVKVK